MVVRVLTWNLFHGRDRAPDPALHTWRSRLFRVTERGETHAQVNRDLFKRFTELLGGSSWDIALLQECPPRWAGALAGDCQAEPHLVLTSRNLPPPLPHLQGWIARVSPDLIASWEGGSNLTLIRGIEAAGPIVERRRSFTLARSPETRRMTFTRLTSGVCIANLHASGARTAAEREVGEAAGVALGWAEGSPLILGGDLNLRPETSPALYAELAELGFVGSPLAGSIDQLLGHRLELLEPPEAWPAAARELPDPTAREQSDALPIRLSDHAPVQARFRVAGPAQPGRSQPTDHRRELSPPG